MVSMLIKCQRTRVRSGTALSAMTFIIKNDNNKKKKKKRGLDTIGTFTAISAKVDNNCDF